jgi:hypothetical protein
MALLNQSTTVNQVIRICSLHTKLQNFLGVGGNTNEPGLTIANSANQMLLAYPNAWKFNRNDSLTFNNTSTGGFFVTQFGVQDYRHAGACAFTLINQNTPPLGTQNCGGAQIDLAASPVNGGTAAISVTAGVVTVQFLDPHPFIVGQTIYMSGNANSVFNSTFTFNGQLQTSAWSNGWVITAVPDNLHVQFTATAGQTNGLTSGAPGINNWGWIESAYLTDINSIGFPLPVKPLIAVDRLAVTYFPNGQDISVAMIVDYNNGVCKFRLSEPMGTYNYAINTVYQQRAPKLVNAGSIFQWRDDLKFVLDEVALFYAFRFAFGMGAADTQAQFKVMNSAVMSARMADDREDTGESLAPDRALMAF